MITTRKAQTGEQLTVIWFFFLVLLMVVAIGAGIYMFYGEGYDARKVDAQVLNDKIEKCIVNNQLETDAEKFKEKFYDVCAIHENVTKQYLYIYIAVDGQKWFEEGKGDQTQCALEQRNDNFPRCANTTFVKEGKTVFIQTGSNQFGRRVLL